MSGHVFLVHLNTFWGRHRTFVRASGDCNDW